MAEKARSEKDAYRLMRSISMVTGRNRLLDESSIVVVTMNHLQLGVKGLTATLAGIDEQRERGGAVGSGV